jgi:hypothetical protein
LGSGQQIAVNLVGVVNRGERAFGLFNFYRFHSFIVACAAFPATWLVLN